MDLLAGFELRLKLLLAGFEWNLKLLLTGFRSVFKEVVGVQMRAFY